MQPYSEYNLSSQNTKVTSFTVRSQKFTSQLNCILFGSKNAAFVMLLQLTQIRLRPFNEIYETKNYKEVIL